MTLLQLKYFIEAVKFGSISEAAKQLFISQPSLSASIKELESELGFDLFLRTGKGISLSPHGSEFLGYARQVVEQTELLENRFFNKKSPRRLFSVSTQHYSFSVNAFARLIREFGEDEYEFALRETRTYEIIENVRLFKSEIGVLYLSEFNRKVLEKLFREKGLVFHSLFTAKPHVFISVRHPLAGKKAVTLKDLEEYPYLSFEQGEYNSFYFSEEILSTAYRKKAILVSDRATIFNLIVGLDGYTISTGIISTELNGTDIISVPLAVEDRIEVGWISHKSVALSKMGECYVEKLNELLAGLDNN